MGPGADHSSSRNEEKARWVLRIKEEDILRAVRLVLPVINAAIATFQDIFSGEPSMTLVVEKAPVSFRVPPAASSMEVDPELGLLCR